MPYNNIIIKERDLKELLKFTEGDAEWAACLLNKFDNNYKIYRYFRTLFGFDFKLSEGYEKIHLDFRCICEYYEHRAFFIHPRILFINKNSLFRLTKLMNNDAELAQELLDFYGSYNNVYNMIACRSKNQIKSRRVILRLEDYL